MSDEFVVLLGPVTLGYVLGALPILHRLCDGPQGARALALAAATGFMAYAMADGGATYLEPWAPTLGLLAGAACTALHMRRHLRDRDRRIRARRDGLLMEMRLRNAAAIPQEDRTDPRP